MPSENVNRDEEYLEILQIIVDTAVELVGRKVALEQARRSPVELDTDGTVEGYYGDGMTATNLLIEQIESVVGASIADSRLKHALEKQGTEEEYALLPERIRPVET